MEIKDTDELEVFYEDDSFVFNYENFVIEYDSHDKVWVASHDDEDVEDEIILKDEEQDFEETDIFGYILTEEEFRKLEKAVEETILGGMK